MLPGPFKHQGKGTLWKRSPQDTQIPQVDQHLVFGIQRVEVRGRVVAPEYLDHDAIEDADRRHASLIRLRQAWEGPLSVDIL